MKTLLSEIKKCTLCEPFLPLGANPVLYAHSENRIIIVGQAPGLAVHNSGIPWNDKSGDRLREWMGLDKSQFYNNPKIGIIPMGFCYPGKGKSGDLPPRKECAPLWHQKLLTQMPQVKTLLLIRKYAQDYYLKDKRTLTERVFNFEEYLPKYIVLPHPSPRNNIWMKKNDWFQKDILPQLQPSISQALI